MAVSATEVKDVAKNKVGEPGKPKRYGTLIRVTDEFAEAIKEASSLEKLSVADFASVYLLPVVTKRYRDTLVSKAKKAEGK
jgi:hypothetical protein